MCASCCKTSVEPIAVQCQMAGTSFLLTIVITVLTVSQYTNSLDNDVVPFGSDCNLQTKCGKFGTWQGGLGKCNRRECGCVLYGQGCYKDDMCCSGRCDINICAKSVRRKDPCSYHTCDTTRDLDCRIMPADNISLVDYRDYQPWGLCELTTLMWHSCDNETFCREEQSWPGGWQNCLKGQCSCKFTCQCYSHRECCSGWCVKGKCKSSTLGGFCHSVWKPHCLGNYGCTKKARLGEFGICDQCSKIGSSCNSATYCCPVGHWPGGYGNCLNNICNCKVEGKCKVDRECCSGNCDRQKKCANGGLYDVCEGATCQTGYGCNYPSNDNSVRRHFGLVRGTCLELNSACGKQAIQPNVGATSRSKIVKKIRGGETVVPHSWPWMVNIRHGKFCGAVLIYPRYLLTAAHCIRPDDVKLLRDIEVSLGAHLYDDPNSRTAKVERILRYPAYRDHPYNPGEDLAILHLSEAVVLSSEISPICLAENSFYVGYDCVVAGWGHLNHSHRGQYPGDLRQVGVKLSTPNERCTHDGVVCTEGFTGPSYGDSGGPLMCKNTVTNQWELLGITAWTHDTYVAYASIPYHKEWILRMIQGVEQQRFEMQEFKLAVIWTRFVDKIISSIQN